MGKRTDTQQQTDGELGFTDSASPYNDTTPPDAEQHTARNAHSRKAAAAAAAAAAAGSGGGTLQAFGGSMGDPTETPRWRISTPIVLFLNKLVCTLYKLIY